MALSKASGLILSTSPISATLESTRSTAINLASSVALLLTARATFDNSALSGALLRLYSSTDNTNYDTVPYDTRELVLPTARGAHQFSFAIDPVPFYIRVTLVNLEAAGGKTITSVNLYSTKQDVA